MSVIELSVIYIYMEFTSYRFKITDLFNVFFILLFGKNWGFRCLPQNTFSAVVLKTFLLCLN